MTATPRPIPALPPVDIARFRSLLKFGGCGLTWGGEINRSGYGIFPIYRQGKRIRFLAHRLAYYLSASEDPGSAEVRHGCDTPPCCTPECLTTGTHADNMQDAWTRGRMSISQLLEYTARRDAEVRERIARGEKRCSKCGSTKPLAAFNLDPSNIDGRGYQCKECRAASRRKAAS